MITLVHELAHAFVFKKHQNAEKPHGEIWQLTFKSLMLNFLTPDYFPDDILRVLGPHMVCPKASTFSDLKLVKVLKRHDNIQSFTISDLSIGEFFKIPNGKSFVKGKKNRTRNKCIEYKTNKVYLFHPLAEVIKI